MGLQTYNQVNRRVERVYFAGTETLESGQPLCFQETPASSTKGFPFDVELPNSANRTVFAGIVSPSSVGITGPAYIDMIVPQRGDVLQVAVSKAADIAVGALLKLNADLDTTTDSGDAGFDAIGAAGTATTSVAGSVIGNTFKEMPGLAVAMESVASSSANNTRSIAYVRFL